MITCCPNKRIFRWLLIVISCLCFNSKLHASIAGHDTVSDERCPYSDTLIYNATIYTAEDKQWRASALAIENGKIIFVGTNDQASIWHCGAKQKHNLHGQFVYPGFTDGHQHLEGVGRRTRTLSLFGLPTLAKTIQTIKAFVSTQQPNDWILGRGWIEREWSDEQRFLTRHDVDDFTPENPLFMPRADGVSALVNTKALELAGVTNDTPDPQGGKFDRDKNGELTGYILGTAMDHIRAVLPSESDDYLRQNLLLGMEANARMGWTQTHDAGMSWKEVKLLQGLHSQGKMMHRVYAAVPIDEAASLFSNGKILTKEHWLIVNGVKVFIDGTLGSRGAALLDSYSDAKHSGFMNRTTKEQLMPVLDMAIQNDVLIMTHVIGDRAVNQVLNWYQEAWSKRQLTVKQQKELRWRLEHAQIIIPSDQRRIVDMHVIPSMQPSHAIGDLNFAPARLGQSRLANAYPWQPLLNKSAKIVGGSDAPVELGDPRIEFYAAITRQRLDGTSGNGWHLEYAVSREDALRMFTVWPAYSIHQSEQLGSLAVGKYADLTVFDTDFMTADPHKILNANVKFTMVGGRIVYQQP